MKIRKIVSLLALSLFLILPLLSLPAQAAELDEILLYEITVDVNDDATLRMRYHIDWKVLDSTSEGPLSWVEIGVPNSHILSADGLSSAVKKIRESGSCVRIDLDRDYYAGEVADIEFEITQDYMYQVDCFTDGETVYQFTPGWFDDIRVDKLVIRWNSRAVLSQSPACILADDGYCTWTTSLDKGETFGVVVTYPNDAYGFDVSKTIDDDSYGYSDSGFDIASVLGGVIFFGTIFLVVFGCILSHFNATANLSGTTQKKITRTRIVYYPECQGCGSTRPEGASNCPYCGRSFIKSEEIIRASDIPEEDRSLRKKTTDGLYRYTSQPNTYIRVHVTNVPAPRVSHSSGFSSRSSHSGGGHSCACASSCACACACACAGGGRAGCSVKDFYNTGLKLRQLAAAEGRRRTR